MWYQTLNFTNIPFDASGTTEPSKEEACFLIFGPSSRYRISLAHSMFHVCVLRPSGLAQWGTFHPQGIDEENPRAQRPRRALPSPAWYDPVLPCRTRDPRAPPCLPDPRSYTLLSRYLYTHRQDLLLASLLPPSSLPSNPFPTTAHLSDSPKLAGSEVHAQLLAFAESLAKDYTQHKLLGGLSTVHGLWKNIVALGVDDEGLWEVIHVAWGVYLTAAGWMDGRLHLRKGELILGYNQ